MQLIGSWLWMAAKALFQPAFENRGITLIQAIPLLFHK
jgi:hypothetical protein